MSIRSFPNVTFDLFLEFVFTIIKFWTWISKLNLTNSKKVIPRNYNNSIGIIWLFMIYIYKTVFTDNT